MASIIRIKRSSVSGNPNTLAAGELAYSALPDNGSNGGDRLYIGIGAETAGNAANHFVIGGKFFTDRLDHTEGKLTASSAIVVDSNSKIDNLKVDNLDLNGNTLSTTNTNGDLLITPNGTGKTIVSNLFIGDDSTSLSEFIFDTVGGVITAGTGITIVNNDGDNSSTVSITNTGVTADTYGSATAIPVITVNAQGQITSATTASITTTLGIAADSGSDSIALATDTITFAGGEGIDTEINASTNTVTISAEDATTSNKGVASFADADFNVTTGAVELKDTVVKSITTDSGALTPSGHSLSILGGEGIDVTHTGSTITVTGEDATSTNKGVASFADANFTVTSGAVSTKTITLGTSTLTNGSTTSSLAGLTELSVDNININGNEITSTDANGNISLNPNGTGTVDVNGARISGLGTPTQDTDAATKLYVDTLAEGLSVKPAVRVATTAAITATYDNGTLGVGSTLTIPATATLDIDGVTDWSVYDGILIKDQTNAFENGRYYVSTIGNVSTAWVLTRCGKCDEPTEIPSMYVFVQEGIVNISTGWVATVEDFADFDVGVDDIIFTQFSGAGTFNAGNGLTLSGSTFNVVGTADRITSNADSIDIASTYAGQSSITTLGTIGTGTWQADVVGPTYGGTGVNNGTKTITLGGSFTHTGAHTLGLTTTADTSVTLPTTGTLATLAGTENLSNKTITSSSFSGTTITASGLISFTNTTDASPSPTSAAVVMDGGLSVAKSIIVGTNITGSGAGTSTLDGFNIDGGTY
jgi:hypothetical protein